MNRRGLFKLMAGGLAALCGGKLLASAESPSRTNTSGMDEILQSPENAAHLQRAMGIRDLRLPDIMV